LDEDWKNYNDFFNTMDYAKEEGLKEGIIEGREEGRAEGIAEGRAEGLTEGEHKKNLENAKGFKEAGTPIAIIAQVTGLSIEEIENL
jgi:predicted transposase YdaD